MNSLVYDSSYPNKVELVELRKPRPQNSSDCIVRITHAALNRRDQWIREGLYPGIVNGVVLGSDGCGSVVEGPDVWVGRTVLINPNIGWGENPATQSSTYQILGMPQNGTLSDFVRVPSDRLIEKPSFLENEYAAAIPLAGLTAFRACFTKAAITSAQKVLITGIGGGVSQFALQFAAAAGAQVFITSSRDDKIEKSVSAGAQNGFNYSEVNWSKQAAEIGGFDAIIDSAGGASVNDYLKLIKPGGRMVFYGSTTGTVPGMNMTRLFWSQAQLIGSTMGNDQEFKNMVSYIEENAIIPVIDHVYKKEDFLEAFNRFKSPEHLGKIVITFQ